MKDVQLYHVHDFCLKSDSSCKNPFLVNLSATFEHESGKMIEQLPGFFNGGNEWVIRFSPDRKGSWKGRTTSDNPDLDGVDLGPIQCIPNENPHVHGTLRIDPQHSQKIAWEDGNPFIILGFEIDWLFSYHQKSPERCRQDIDLIAERGFNYIVTTIYSHTGFAVVDEKAQRPITFGNTAKLKGAPPPPECVYGPPERYLFGGSNEEPDHDSMNIDFFTDFDSLIGFLHTKGIVAHLMFQVQNKHVKWPKRLSTQDDLFWQYIVARYQAFGNIVWDLSKEVYLFHEETGTHDYTINRINFIRKHDVYGHLITLMDAELESSGRYSKPDELCDIFSDQVHFGDVDNYNREAIRSLRSLDKPYFNIEYGYETGAEQLSMYDFFTTAHWEEVLKWTYAIYMAGAYANYYYNNTGWDIIKFDPEPPGWKRYRYLKDFFDDVSFNKMTADNELVKRGYCLADIGKEYVVYLPEGGDAIIDLSAIPGKSGNCGEWVPGNIGVTALWMNIFTGERKQKDVVPQGFNSIVENPFSDTSQPFVVAIKTMK